MTTYKDLRKRANLSTDEAAQKLGISKSMLYKMEQGYKNPSYKLMKKMSEVYHCSIQELFNALNITDSDIGITNSRGRRAAK